MMTSRSPAVKMTKQKKFVNHFIRTPVKRRLTTDLETSSLTVFRDKPEQHKSVGVLIQSLSDVKLIDIYTTY
jgi:hypothetical protein